MKTENRTKKSLIALTDYCFDWKYYFCPKNTDFLQKILTSAKLRGLRY